MRYPQRTIRPASLVASAVLAAVALVACGNGLDSSPTGSSATGTSGTPTQSATGAATASASTSQPAPGTSPGNGICGVDQLSVGSRQPAGAGAAGHRYLVITFTNTSPSLCVLDGHPRVDFVGKAHGTQLGTSADRVGELRRVSLRPGKTTTALLRIANTGDYGAAQCQPTTAEGLRVYPPDSRLRVLLQYRTKACQAELGHGHSQLQISAVGTPPTVSAAVDRTCAEQTLSQMSLADKVGQLFMVGVNAEPTTQQLDLITRYHLGGALLAHNSGTGVASTRSRTRLLQEAASAGGVRLWVAVDQEGGYVQHLQGPGFSDIPTALTQGTWSPSTLRARSRTWGRQLRDAGVNLNLAPVADTVSKELGAGNPPIGYYSREYGHHPAAVSRHALAVRRGMKDAHVQATAKHFPDLGRVHVNTDTTYGATDHTTTRHGHYAVRPFRALVHDRIPLVMISSARYTRIDPRHIGPMSSTIMRGMLRHDMRFRGTVISDSLTAAALSHVPENQRALRFLQAGGNVALVGSSSAAAAMVLTVLDHARQHRKHTLVDGAALQVLQSKNRQGLLPCSPHPAPGPARG